MKDSLAFQILTNIMSFNDEWEAESPSPSTSQDGVEPSIRFQGADETIQGFYEDVPVDPMWTESLVELASEETNDTDIDFLQDNSFLDASMSDVVKVELKSRIQEKRKASGQEEIVVKFDQPEPEKLSQEEEILRFERREKNRLAAQKCRTKKRERTEVLEMDIDRLENRQENLKGEIQKLEDEKEHLQEIIQVHQVVCPKIRKLSDS